MLSLRLTPLVVLLSAAPLLASPPNVVFLCSDDQRFDTIHALGNSHIETPALDAMVANPILIERPLVETDKGVRLGRPPEKVREIL